MLVLKYIKNNKIKTLLIGSVFVWFYYCLPTQLFNSPTSTVIESSDGILIGAKIASDGQWRFPEIEEVPSKFETCIVQFEDAYYYKHFGFNPISIGKAFYENYKSGKVKRGGSTITQQVVRLSRNGKKRTYWEKIKEIIFAFRLEFRLSKKEILNKYASFAPFGGNVVGLEAASWRYFGIPSKNLSWAESATLAVLPNAPSLIYPGKNHEKLVKKRNRLLAKLLHVNKIDSLTYKLAIQESLPQKPRPLPRVAPHLLDHLSKKHSGKKIVTSVDLSLQSKVNSIVKNHYKELKQNEIHNMCVLVLDVETRKVLAYVGNTPTDETHQKDVNIIHKNRSTGSILKPLLFAGMLDGGELLPTTIVADVPTQIASYHPQNFNMKYDGAVSASKALSRSLNVPAVRMLQQFGLNRFHDYLKEMQLEGVRFHSDHYGLSLILGGAECNLWDLCKTYAAFSGTINNYDKTYGDYFSKEFCEPSFLKNEKVDFGIRSKEKNIFDAGSIYLTYKALQEVNRPEGNENWEFFDSSKKIAWKTGTSFGFRDAWAIGTSKKYVVGVWVGNADGEGRPGLTGVSSAGPVLFDVFDVLPGSNWFIEPSDELSEAIICKKSGYIAKEICKERDTVLVPNSGLDTEPCPYHLWVHLDENEQYQVNTSCEQLHKIKHQSWFVLPPLMGYYYKQKNPFYKPLPEYRSDCSFEGKKIMDFVYPKEFSKIYLPKNLEESKNQLVFKLVHSVPDTKVFWYLDSDFIGETKAIHEFALSIPVGKHKLTVVDALGNELKRRFEIIE
mgnify:CR=1 FL=1